MGNNVDIEKAWLSPLIFQQSFAECRECFNAVILRAGEVVISPQGIPSEFVVRLETFPKDFLSVRRHLFSVLFQSMYALLGLSTAKRLLYGKFNYLFRIWVTSADNLLDDEDKITLPLRMPGQGHVMKQVVAIMAADRAMSVILNEAVSEQVLSYEQAEKLSALTLQVLLPSAAQEASEEGGISRRLSPQEILEKIHVLKTGILFNLPFMGPSSIESDLDEVLIVGLKQGLMDFGIGCQILDDIRDVAIDFKEKRQNYLLSQIYYFDPAAFNTQLKGLEDNPDSLYNDLNMLEKFISPAAQVGNDYLIKGLLRLKAHGLGLDDMDIENIAVSMFHVLHLGEAQQWLKPSLL